MVRRKRFDVFFVLYLCAVGVFVIVSRERDTREAVLRARSEVVVRSFLRPLTLELPDSVVTVYVDADSRGRVAPGARTYRDRIVVADIGPRDSVGVELMSLSLDNTLISPAAVAVHGRRGVGELRDRTVAFPFECRFDQTGDYVLTFDAHARRIRLGDDGLYHYGDVSFSSGAVDAELVRRLEHARTSLRVHVRDTSATRTFAWARMRAAVETQSIATARGYQVNNTITVTHPLPVSSARIVRGYGAIELHSHSTSLSEYHWSGTARGGSDTVTVEFRIDKTGQVVDVLQVSFVVNSVEPFLDSAVPEYVYAGEDLACSISVAGLTDTRAYRWELLEVAGGSKASVKDTGVGTQIRYHLPNNFAGKVLRVRATYRGKPYEYISPLSYEGGTSTFTFRVVDPPTHINVELPARPRLLQPISFTARMFSDPRYEQDRPVASLKDVDVKLWRVSGGVGYRKKDLIRTDLTMLSMGRFQISVRRGNEQDTVAVPARVRLEIRARKTQVEKEFTLYE
ncbi:MAG: hypothetical protein HY962_11655 [Ignavibacteriae bacterium]|nr:hypothetical protein [Ignavibacteriota bacterium]